MMAAFEQTDEKKKVYAKPEVTEVKLVAEEAVLSTCKLGNSITQGSCGGDLSCIANATS